MTSVRDFGGLRADLHKGAVSLTQFNSGGIIPFRRPGGDLFATKSLSQMVDLFRFFGVRGYGRIFAADRADLATASGSTGISLGRSKDPSAGMRTQVGQNGGLRGGRSAPNLARSALAATHGRPDA